MLTHSELTGGNKFAFLRSCASLIVVTLVNHEERSSALLEDLHDYLLANRLDITIHHACVSLAIEADSWLLRDLELKSRVRGNQKLESLRSAGYVITEKEHAIQFPGKAAGTYRLLLDRMHREAGDGGAVLCDLSALPRSLLFTLADYVHEAAARDPRTRRQFRFAYAWAKSYFPIAERGAPLTLRSHRDGLGLHDCIDPKENAYFFLIANGYGPDTAQAVDAYAMARKTSPLVVDDFVFLFHKTAPHDFIRKARANGHVFAARGEGDIGYIFSSLQVGRLLSDRADELCRRSPGIENLTMLYVPLGPKPCQFATYFGMRTMENRLTKHGCRVNYCDVFYHQNEERRTLHSRGVDYCSILELEAEISDEANS